MAAMFAAVSFPGCSDDDDKIDPNQIAGTWQITLSEGWSVDNDGARKEWSYSYPLEDGGDYYYWTYTFDGYGKMTRVGYENQSISSETNGTYTVSNNVLTIVAKDEYYEETYIFQIKKLTPTQLILFEYVIDPEFTMESTDTFKRVR